MHGSSHPQHLHLIVPLDWRTSIIVGCVKNKCCQLGQLHHDSCGIFSLTEALVSPGIKPLRSCVTAVTKLMGLCMMSYRVGDGRLFVLYFPKLVSFSTSRLGGVHL